MVKIKHHLLFLNIFVFIVLAMFLITNNVHQVIAGSKEHGKDIISPKAEKEEAKQNVTKYFELYNALENCSEEKRNTIIQILSDPKMMKIFEEEAKKETTEKNQNLEKGSSSKQLDDDQLKK